MQDETRSSAGGSGAVERVARAATASSKAPDWLAQVIGIIADHADEIPPLPDDRVGLPEFIYRH